MVSVTYDHAFLDDLNSVSGWTEDVGLGGNGTFTLDNFDYFKLENTGGAVDYFLDNDANISANTATYPILYYRYKTSDTSIKAQIIVEWDGATTETVLTETSSTTWIAGYKEFTTSDVIDHIRFYANDAVGYVWYDFALICKGIFTFPNQAHGIRSDFPPKEAFLGIPHRDTDITQNLGSRNAVVDIGCNLDIGDWKRTSPVDNKDGDVFRDIHHNRSSEPWQWLDYDEGQMKATIHPWFSTVPSGGRLERRVDLTCTEYSFGNKDAETYVERFGLNL